MFTPSISFARLLTEIPLIPTEPYLPPKGDLFPKWLLLTPETIPYIVFIKVTFPDSPLSLIN